MVIRADGGPAIGLGHVLRAVALAEAWSRAGGAAVLATKTPSAITSRGDGRHDIGTIAEHASDDEQTIALAIARGAEWVACDGYGFDEAYVGRLRGRGLRVMRIVDSPSDPIGAADLVLDQNIGAERLRYPVDVWTRLALGTRYALVREVIQRSRRSREYAESPRRIVLLTGGADVAALAPRFVRAFRSVVDDALRCDVILGPASRSIDATLDAIGGDDRVAVHVDPPDPGVLMARADVAISAGGTTCWELCCLGVPMILVAVAENQIRITTGLAAAGAAIDLGWHASATDVALARALDDLIRDGRRREMLGRSGSALVDGEGGDRVVAMIRSVSAS